MSHHQRHPSWFIGIILILTGCGVDSQDGGTGTAEPSLAGDGVAPTLVIAADSESVLVGEALSVSFTVSEAVTGLSLDTLQVVHGTATDFRAVDATHFIVSVTAAMEAGTLTITVPAGSIRDADRNPLLHAASIAVPIAVAPEAPWASAQGTDVTGPWADITVASQELTATQRFRWIPAGRFIMGSPPGEANRWDLHETQHQVVLTRGFWMADSECTQRMWKAVMNATPSYFSATGADGLDLPVEQVSWDDIQGASGFLSVLGTLAPTFPGTLPTEAQWEYACRAGTTTALYNGDITILGDANAPALDPIAWYLGNAGVYTGETAPTPLYDTTGWSADRQYPDVMQGTHHVKRKTANAWGLYDMIGNVREWCADNMLDDLGSTAVVDPTGPASGSVRVFRGGNWHSGALFCRAAIRLGLVPAGRDIGLGFRLSASGRPRVVSAPRSIQ